MLTAKSKKILATLSGNIMEFYDFIVYAFLSSYISQLFFPKQDPLIATIMTFGVFASGYLSRPLGALFFGHIGDKYGRKPSLVFSILLITLSTVCIGLLPTYEQLGLFAPILLVICRLIQGFSVSGEEGGAAVYLTESLQNKYKGLLGASILGSAYFGVLLGSLTCLGLTSYFSESELVAYAWRLPFIGSVFLGLIALYLRLTTSESSTYKTMKEQGALTENPIQSVFQHKSKQMCLQILLVAALSIPVYLYTVFLPSYLTSIIGMPLQTSLQISVASLCFLSIGVPIFGYISDMIGYQKQFRLGCFLLIILAYPIFQCFSAGVIWQVFLGLSILGLALFCIAGPIFAILIDSYPTNVRFSGVSIVFNVSMTIFGSTAPMVSFYLIKALGQNNAPWIYVAVAGILGLSSLMLLEEETETQTAESPSIDSEENLAV